jgi:hypothetical protein
MGCIPVFLAGADRSAPAKRIQKHRRTPAWPRVTPSGGDPIREWMQSDAHVFVLASEKGVAHVETIRRPTPF